MIKVNGKLQQFNSGRTTNGPDPLGIKFWVIPLGKKPQPAEVLAESKGNKERVVEKGILLQDCDIRNLPSLQSVACPVDFRLKSSTSTHLNFQPAGLPFRLASPHNWVSWFLKINLSPLLCIYVHMCTCAYVYTLYMYIPISYWFYFSAEP